VKKNNFVKRFKLVFLLKFG